MILSGSRSTYDDFMLRWYRITSRDRALFYEHISNLLEGGVTLLPAMKSFAEKTKNFLFAQELTQLIHFVESGDSVSLGMKKMPRVFSRQEVAIIEAGEQSGTLQTSLRTIAEELRREQDLRSKVSGAMTYPAIVIAFLILAIGVVMAYVVPEMQPLFASSGADLPAVTQSLIAVSDFIRYQFWWILIALILCILGWQTYTSTESGLYEWDLLKVKLPIIGPLYRNYLIVRASSTLASLIGSGIPILKTFELTGESVSNSAFQRVLDATRFSIQKGKKITESMEESDPKGFFFGSDFIQMVGAGERTSTLNKVCEKLADQYRREVDYSVTNLVKFIEPTAILIAGIFVAWFAFGIFSAVMKIVSTVQQ